MQSDVFISVVSPVYKAAEILPALCERITKALDPITSRYEIILVCDGSPDDSWAVLEKLAQQYPKIIAVQLSRNFGQHYAITAGLDLARGEWTVLMDCDLQDPPEEIPRLLEKAKEGYDIVVARRMGRQHAWWKRTTSRAFYKAFHLLAGYELRSDVGSFRIMHHAVVDALSQLRESHRMFGGLVNWVGFETTYLDVQHAQRYAGESSYGFWRLVQLAFDGLISFSNRPLYISVVAGITMSALSGVYGLSLIARWFATGMVSAVPGWLSTVIAITFIGGLILLNQGVLGIYLGRLYNQAKQRPLYVVKKIVATAPITKIKAKKA